MFLQSEFGPQMFNSHSSISKQFRPLPYGFKIKYLFVKLDYVGVRKRPIIEQSLKLMCELWDKWQTLSAFAVEEN